MLTIPNPNITDGDDFSVIPLMANILAILAGVQSFDGSQIQAGTVIASALATGLNPLARDTDFFNSFVVSGLMPTGYTGFNFTMPNGVAYVNFNNLLTKYSVTGANYTVTTSKDTYYNLKSDGTLDTPSALANNAAVPTIATGYQYLIRVVSDGTGIVRIDDLRNLNPLKAATQTDSNGWKVRNHGTHKEYVKTFAVNTTVAGAGNRVSAQTNQVLPIGIATTGSVRWQITYRGNFSGHCTVGTEDGSSSAVFNLNIGNIWPSSLNFVGNIDVTLTDL